MLFAGRSLDIISKQLNEQAIGFGVLMLMAFVLTYFTLTLAQNFGLYSVFVQAERNINETISLIRQVGNYC